MRGEEKINIKLFFVQYEPYYTGATTAGAQYVFATGNSQNTTSGNANGSGTSINGNGVTSPSTGPPPLQSLPPPPTHFYASTATHHHHHPAVPAGPPASQMDRSCCICGSGVSVSRNSSQRINSFRTISLEGTTSFVCG